MLTAGPAHGYELFQTLEGELGPTWETRQSHLYLTVARMERDGLVVGKWIRQGTLPDRQVLELTAKGWAVADRWLKAPDPASEMVVKLAVARVARPELFEDLAALVSDEVAGRIKSLRGLSGLANPGFQQQAIALEIARRQAEIRWLSSIRDDATAILAQPRGGRRARPIERRSELVG